MLPPKNIKKINPHTSHSPNLSPSPMGMSCVERARRSHHRHHTAPPESNNIHPLCLKTAQSRCPVICGYWLTSLAASRITREHRSGLACIGVWGGRFPCSVLVISKNNNKRYFISHLPKQFSIFFLWKHFNPDDENLLLLFFLCCRYKILFFNSRFSIRPTF